MYTYCFVTCLNENVQGGGYDYDFVDHLCWCWWSSLSIIQLNILRDMNHMTVILLNYISLDLYARWIICVALWFRIYLF